ncbi:hypothetical protein HAX54_047934, partial [Datura stramonium]|nr:hypothetical protein [Datura stramonium]
MPKNYTQLENGSLPPANLHPTVGLAPSVFVAFGVSRLGMTESLVQPPMCHCLPLPAQCFSSASNQCSVNWHR